MHLSLPEQLPLLFLILASYVCVSSVSTFCPDTRGRRWSLVYAHSSVVLWGGRKEHCKQMSLACVGSARSVWTPLGFPQFTVACAFRVYTAQVPGCSAGLLSNAGPVSHALPRSKLLRFSLFTLQGHRVGWACVLWHSQVGVTQATRCLASTPSQAGRVS